MTFTVRESYSIRIYLYLHLTLYVCTCIRIHAHTHTQICLCEFQARPAPFLPSHTHHLATMRMNFITHTLYPHSCQHRKLRPARLNPYSSAHTLSGPSRILFRSETFPLWPLKFLPLSQVQNPLPLPIFSERSLHLPVLAETSISSEDVTSASNFLKWYLFSLLNWGQALRLRSGTGDIALDGSSQTILLPSSLNTPIFEPCIHHLNHLPPLLVAIIC